MSSPLVALVTGAGQGIGRAIALRLAKDGFNVALNDLPSSLPQIEALRSEITKRGGKAILVPADVAQESEVQNIIASTVEGLGSLDTMIANAGIVRSTPLLETPLEQWDEVLAVNSRSAFLCYKYAAKQMISQGHGGKILGASSLAGKQGESSPPPARHPIMSSYSASKFAIRGLTQVAATELAPFGITVNAYAPGLIDTNMKLQLGEAYGNPDEFDSLVNALLISMMRMLC
ncbi:hypothetical protein ONZ45_g12054 [Pleurotus djamor]|nr:hypothetical protein ONZ45_g12054 [Pleurotus djamor]